MRGRAVKFLALGVIWAVNPTYLGGCSAETYSFGEPEMLELMSVINEEGWTIETDDGVFELSFDVHQASEPQASARSTLGWMATAQACGSRSFVAEAGACIDDTSMALEGTVTITDTSMLLGSTTLRFINLSPRPLFG